MKLVNAGICAGGGKTSGGRRLWAADSERQRTLDCERLKMEQKGRKYCGGKEQYSKTESYREGEAGRVPQILHHIFCQHHRGGPGSCGSSGICAQAPDGI